MSITNSATHSLALAITNDGGLGVQDSVQRARESKVSITAEGAYTWNVVE